MSKYFPLTILILVIILGFTLRVYKLSTLPAGFFCDEAAIGYNAYSLLKTGADEHSQPFPFFFRSFGAYRNPIPIYANIPSIALFGLNEFSVRLTTALMGTLTILLVFLLTQKLFGNTPAIFTALFLTISPWHIHFSRFGAEYISFPFFFTLAFYLFLLGRKKTYFLPLSGLAFGISLYTYYPAWLIVPVFLLGLTVFHFRYLQKYKKLSSFAITLFLMSLIPLAWGVEQGTALTRWQQVSTFQVFASENRNPLQSLPSLFNTYLAHFSPQFLFTKGDIDFPGHFITRFSVKGMGELYLFQLPLLLIGLFYLLKNIKAPSSQTLLVWFALYPLGSTLIGTDGGGPFAFRSIIGVIPFQILSGLALATLFSSFSQKNSIHAHLLLFKILFLGIFFTITAISLKNYLHRYFTEYPLYSSDFWGWQYGPREVMQYFISAKDNYDNLYLMGDFNSPEIFIKFYDPENLCQNRCAIGGLAQFNPTQKQLFAVSLPRMAEIPLYLSPQIRYTIYYPNREPAFHLLEIISP